MIRRRGDITIKILSLGRTGLKLGLVVILWKPPLSTASVGLHGYSERLGGADNNLGDAKPPQEMLIAAGSDRAFEHYAA